MYEQICQVDIDKSAHEMYEQTCQVDIGKSAHLIIPSRNFPLTLAPAPTCIGRKIENEVKCPVLDFDTVHHVVGKNIVVVLMVCT